MPRQVDHAARRRVVVEALWRVVVRDGLERATVRSVAAEAGLALGTVTPFFAGTDAMHLHAMELVAQRTNERARTTDASGAPVDAVLRLLSAAMPVDDERRAEAAVYYAFLGRARVDDRFRDVADRVDEGLRSLHRRAVDALVPDRVAEPERRLLAAELQALTEGLAFGIVTFPARNPADRAQRVLRRHLERLAAL